MEIVIPVDELNPRWSELLANELGRRDLTLVHAQVEEVSGGYHIRIRTHGEQLSPSEVLELQLAMLGEEEESLWPTSRADGLEEETTELDPESPQQRIPA